jgi:hypothetical protein
MRSFKTASLLFVAVATLTNALDDVNRETQAEKVSHYFKVKCDECVQCTLINLTVLILISIFLKGRSRC